MNKKKYKLQKDITLLTFSLFIVVFFWIASSVYDAFITSTLNETLQTQIVPIDGTFDTQTLQNLENRTNIQPEYDSPFSGGIDQLSLSPTPSLFPSLGPTPASDIVATDSGESIQTEVQP